MVDKLTQVLERYKTKPDDVHLNILSRIIGEFYASDQVQHILSNAETMRREQISKYRDELDVIMVRLKDLEPLIEEFRGMEGEVAQRKAALNQCKKQVQDLEYCKGQSNQDLKEVQKRIGDLTTTIKSNEEQISKLDGELRKLHGHYTKYFESQQEVFGVIGEQSRISDRIGTIKKELDVKLKTLDVLLTETLPNYKKYDWDELKEKLKQHD